MPAYNGDGKYTVNELVNLKLADSTAPTDRSAMILDTSASDDSQISVKACDAANSELFLGLYDEDASDASKCDTPLGKSVGLISKGQACARVSGSGTRGNLLKTATDATLASGSASDNWVAKALKSWSSATRIPVLLRG